MRLFSSLSWAALLGLVLAAEPAAAASASSSYHETLSLQTLPDGKLLSLFTFAFAGDELPEVQLNTGAAITLSSHTHLPPHLLSLLTSHRVSSLSLSLSSGRWAPTWGRSPLAVPSGTEVVAWLAQPDQGWDELVAGLGGLFCASIGRGKELSNSPGRVFTPEGTVGRTDELRHLHQPSLAAACTESLTPFVALLPCGTRAGLGSWLNPHKLFDGDWTALTVSYGRDDRGGWSVKLSVGSVLDPVRRERLLGGMGRKDFKTSVMYGRPGVERLCPVADRTEVGFVIPTDSQTAFEISPAEGKSDVEGSAVWDLKEVVKDGRAFDAEVRWPQEMVFKHPNPREVPLPPITVRRITKGQGQQRGRLGVSIANHGKVPLQVVYAETLPWFLRLFVSQLEFHPFTRAEVLSDFLYTPAVVRKSPSTLQLSLSIPAGREVEVTFGYETTFLWYTEYPPDSHRGFEIPGAVVRLLGDGRPAGKADLFWTPSTLVDFPTPDFSMPYNVIILTGTVVALFFGGAFNGLRRKWVLIWLDEEPAVAPPVAVAAK